MKEHIIIKDDKGKKHTFHNLKELINTMNPDKQLSSQALNALTGDYLTSLSRIDNKYYVCRVEDWKRIESMTTLERKDLARRCDKEFIQLIKQLRREKSNDQKEASR